MRGGAAVLQLGCLLSWSLGWDLVFRSLTWVLWCSVMGGFASGRFCSLLVESFALWVRGGVVVLRRVPNFLGFWLGTWALSACVGLI